MEYIELLKKFVSGEVSIQNFQDLYFSDADLQNFLQEKLPCNMLKYASVGWNNGNINNALKKILWGTKGGNYEVQCLIARWLRDNDIKCDVTPLYEEEFDFLLDVMPNYINGIKAEKLVEEIIKSVPNTIPSTKRKKAIKEKIKESFYVLDGKYPRWAQDTDWPFSPTEKPLKYLSSKRCGDLVQHTFADIDTGITTVVEEFY